MVELETWKEYGEQFPCGSDDWSLVAVEERDREVYKDLTKGTCQSYHYYVSQQNGVLKYSADSGIVFEEVLESIYHYICNELDQAVAEHDRVSVVSSTALVLLVSLWGSEPIKYETSYYKSYSKDVFKLHVAQL